MAAGPEGSVLLVSLVPLKAVVSPWRRALLGCLVPGRLVPLKALAAPWRRAPPVCLLPGRLGPLKAAVAAP